MRPLDKVLVASSDIYERLIEHTDKKVEHVPLGVNLELFQPRAVAAVQRRSVILYVGRLSQEKDLDVLFEAFRILNRDGAYQLQIIGDGPLRAKTERFVRSTPDTVYVGPIPYGESLAARYTLADVLALPSRNETFGLAILEALASGLPVVAIDQGGPSSLLHPQVGALAAPGDASDFAGKIAQVLASRMSAERCRAYAKQHFSWDKTFVKLLDIYDNLYRAASPRACEKPL
jgi:glycosyltransferase involved in cell wall biosynthesis